MEGVFYVAGAYVVATLMKYAKQPRVKEPVAPSLCLACANAVVTRGTRGEESFACNYGGAMRPVKFTVCECTGYAARGGSCKLVTIEGFARETREVFAEVRVP
jgi:hypothetical protein